MNPCNWHKINDDVAIASIQKCASTSMTALLGEPVPPSKVVDCRNRVVFIRHPIARLVSSYNSLSRDSYLPKSVYDWDSFIDHTFMVEDVHWEPQTDLLQYNGDLFATVLEQFENIERRWDCYVDQQLTWMNRTLQAGHSTHRSNELAFKYAEDKVLWNLAGQGT